MVKERANQNRPVFNVDICLNVLTRNSNRATQNLEFCGEMKFEVLSN